MLPLVLNVMWHVTVTGESKLVALRRHKHEDREHILKQEAVVETYR